MRKSCECGHDNKITEQMLVDYLIHPIPGGRDNRNAGIFVKHGHVATDVTLDIGKSLGEEIEKKDEGQDKDSTTITPPIAAQVGDAIKNSKPKSHERNTKTSQIPKPESSKTIASRESGISPIDDSNKVDNQNSNPQQGQTTFQGGKGGAPEKNSNPQKQVIFNKKSAAQKLRRLRENYHYSDEEEKLVKVLAGAGEKMTQLDAAASLHKTPSWVSRHSLRLCTLGVMWKNPGHNEGYIANIEYYKFGKSKPGMDSAVLTPEQEFDAVKDEIGLDPASLAKPEEQEEMVEQEQEPGLEQVEKTMLDLVVDREFKKIIPPLRPEELQGLEESLAEEGLREPLMVWQGIILDGHNRYELCKKLGIQIRIQEIQLPDRDAAKKWMLKNQLARRNLSPDESSALRAELYEMKKTNVGGQEGHSFDGNQYGDKDHQGEAVKITTSPPQTTTTDSSENDLTPEQEFDAVKDEIGLDPASLAKPEEQVVPENQTVPADRSTPVQGDSANQSESEEMKEHYIGLHKTDVFCEICSQSLEKYTNELRARSKWEPEFSEESIKRLKDNNQFHGAMENKRIKDIPDAIRTHIKEMGGNPNVEFISTTTGIRYTVQASGATARDAKKNRYDLALWIHDELQTSYDIRAGFTPKTKSDIVLEPRKKKVLGKLKSGKNATTDISHKKRIEVEQGDDNDVDDVEALGKIIEQFPSVQKAITANQGDTKELIKDVKELKETQKELIASNREVIQSNLATNQSVQELVNLLKHPAQPEMKSKPAITEPYT